MNNNSREAEFGKLRSRIFPIHGYEIKKFVPLAFLFFCISFDYSVLRATKDIFVLSAADADSIYYIKTFGVMPAVFLFTFAYSYANRKLGRDGRFNLTIIYFLMFFLVYLFVLLPNAANLKLDSFADSMIVSVPKFKGLWEIIRNWHITLYYIHSDAWGTFALQIAFWSFANDVINLKQAKRFYGYLIAIGANIGAICAGLSLRHVLKGDPQMILTSIIAIGMLAILAYNYLIRAIAANPEEYQIEATPKKKKKKVKLPFLKSMAILFRSQYLMLIAVLVLGYNVSIALFESVWKDSVKLFSKGNPEILSLVYGNQLTYIGITTILLLFVLGPWVRQKGWKINALMTPIVFAIGSSVFFAFMFFGTNVASMMGKENIDTLMYAVFIGLANVVFIKGAKYAFFDSSKEMAYIPLSDEEKVNGKAAVDGIGSRLGKSLGGLLVTLVFIQLADGTISGAKHYISASIMIIVTVWIFAVIKLGSMYKKITAQKDSEKEESTNK